MSTDGAGMKTTFRAGGPAGTNPEVSFSGTYTLVADVSEFQPDVNDAAYLAWSHGMIIRGAYGTRVDKAWYGGQRRADLHAGGAKFLGIYQYLEAGLSGASQARLLNSLVGGLEQGEVVIADFEEGSKPMLTDWYNAMLGYGYPDKYLWTYTGTDFGQSQGALPVQWQAQYSSTEPSSPHVLWQFSSAYPVPGVGTTDCSVFHGTITQLAAYGYQPVPAPPKPPAPPSGAPHTAPDPVTVTNNGSEVTFTYPAVGGATGYEFDVFGTGGSAIGDWTVPGTKMVVHVYGHQQFQWKARAVNAAGPGPWGDTKTYTMS